METYPNAALSNINYTWIILGSNPILLYKKPTSNQMRSSTLFVAESNGPVLKRVNGGI